MSLKITCFKTALLMLGCAFAFSNCTVDHRYDVDKIEECLTKEEISLFQDGIVIPIGETKEIRVDSLIKMSDSSAFEESSNIKINEKGEIIAVFDEEYEFSDVLDDFSIADIFTVPSFSFQSEFNSSITEISTKAVTVPAIAINLDGSKTFNAFGNADIPGQVVSLGKIKFKDADMKIRIEIEGAPVLDKSTYNIDATITFPDFFVPNSIEVKGSFVQQDGSTYFQCQPIALESIDLSNIQVSSLRSSEGLSGTITIEGAISATDVEINPAVLSSTVTEKIIVEIGNKGGMLSILSAQAKIDHDIDMTQYISLGDSDDIIQLIKDGQLAFRTNLPNAQVKATMYANSAIPMNLSAKVLEMKNNIINHNTPLFSCAFEVPYCLDGKTATSTVEGEFNFNPILNNIDDSLVVSVAGSVDKTRYCELNSDIKYSIGANFAVTLPLTLGEGTIIEATDTILINEANNQILASTIIGLEGICYNGIPLSAEVEFQPLDGKAFIPLEEPCKLSLKAKEENNIRFVFHPKPEAKTMNLTGILVRIKVEGRNEVLRGDNYFKFKDIVLYVPQGVEIDIDEINKEVGLNQ